MTRRADFVSMVEAARLRCVLVGYFVVVVGRRRRRRLGRRFWVWFSWVVTWGRLGRRRESFAMVCRVGF